MAIYSSAGSDTFPAHHIIQVLQTVKTDTWSTTAAGDAGALVTGLAKAITPAHTSNKVMAHASVYAGATAYSQYLWIKHNGSGSYQHLSNGSETSLGNSEGSTTRVMFGGQGGTAEADEASTATMFFWILLLKIRHLHTKFMLVNEPQVLCILIGQQMQLMLTT